MSSDPALTDKNGWDGKLRVDKKAQIVNAELSADDSDEEVPVQQIQADEGSSNDAINRPH